MMNFKCPNCSGEMNVSHTGDLVCSYCGTKQVMSDEALRQYKEYRYRMLVYLSAISDSADPEKTERIWSHAERIPFTAKDGNPIEINCLFSGEQDGVTVYTARQNAIFLFPKDASEMAARFLDAPTRLQYPSADIKGLSAYFPAINRVFELADGRTLVCVSKNEECFPLSAFGCLPAEHVAWIISRLENLCCALAYSDYAHNGIDLESVFINARTHEAFLLGGWWNAAPSANGSRQDLTAIRRLAKRVAGTRYYDAPAGFRRFVEVVPAKDAYSDFAAWDKTIESSFGGRRFKKLDLSNLKTF